MGLVICAASKVVQHMTINVKASRRMFCSMLHILRSQVGSPWGKKRVDPLIRIMVAWRTQMFI